MDSVVWFLVIPITLFASYSILRLFGVFENSVGVSQHSTIVEEREKLNKKRGKEKGKLDVYHHLTLYFKGLLFNPLTQEKHKFLIERLNLRSKVLDRFYSPEELRGKYILVLLVGVMIIPLAVFKPPLLLFTGVAILFFSQYQRQLENRVQDEDEIIDIYFIDLYLLMYSKLRMGSKGRLTPVVESYIDTLKTSSGDSAMRETMLKLAEFLLNNLSMYEDHVAVPMLRHRYRSATIVNFCNVATQALQGIDNADTLLTTKMDLVGKKGDLMRKNARKLKAKGERAIYLIYIILFIFIGVGWYSKLPSGMF